MQSDHVFIHFVESAKFNQGKNRLYEGIGGNMFAYACKKSNEKGLGGFVAFIAKTKLVEHYKNTLDARQVHGDRMFIDDINSKILINQYFKT